MKGKYFQQECWIIEVKIMELVLNRENFLDFQNNPFFVKENVIFHSCEEC